MYPPERRARDRAGAGLALLGGVALTALGVGALGIGGAALVIAPALWILRWGPPPATQAAPPFSSLSVPAGDEVS